MERTLATIKETHRRNNGYYYGENGDWLVAYTSYRDADILDRANMEAFRRILDAIDPTDADDGPDWCVETSSHWAVGYIEYLLVKLETEAHTKALDVIERYNDYPVIDDELYSDMEYAEVTENCGTAFLDWYRDLRGWDNKLIDLAEDVAPYIASYACDIGDEIREEYWPGKDVIFWGFVRYRLATKHATQ